jgi:hypothetical protein
MKKGIDILRELEAYRKRIESGETTSGCHDHTIRMCSAIVAEAFGYKSRCDWTDIINAPEHIEKINQEIDRQYWIFTRCANARPPEGKLYEQRKYYEDLLTNAG